MAVKKQSEEVQKCDKDPDDGHIENSLFVCSLLCLSRLAGNGGVIFWNPSRVRPPLSLLRSFFTSQGPSPVREGL